MSVGSGETESVKVRAGVQATDRLCIPHRKRMVHRYATSASGLRELYIYYGVKEISFDEERLFPFGEQLVSQQSFVAETATTWGPGYEWSEVRPMLEALLHEGIIQHDNSVDDPRGGGLVPSQLPPSTCPVPRSWTPDQCEAITRDLGGRAVEIGHMESVLSVYRLAHPALDADGRQVGEANVFPPDLRLDRETEWRVCQYSGSRYRDRAPMNITALKAMIKYWKPIMAVLLQVRGELLARLQRPWQGWTVGDLHMLSCVVLTVPGYQLLKGASDAPPPVHPILSSLFRITDGIRMVTHEMMFLSAERTKPPDEMVTAGDVHSWAERNGLLLGAAGVCAGPKALIDEFLATAVDGVPVQGLDSIELPPEVRDLLAELPDILDYSLLGLQTWGVSRSVWLAMSKTYKALRPIFETANGETAERLRERLADGWRGLDQGKVADDYERDVHEVVYRDIYEQSWRALRSPLGPPTHAERVAPVPVGAAHVAAARRLRVILTGRLADSRFGDRPIASVIDQIVGLLVHFMREEQAILASTAELQRAINDMLVRPQPARPLTTRDLRVHYAMYGGSIARFPYLFDMLDDELGIRVDTTAGAIEITDRRASDA